MLTTKHFSISNFEAFYLVVREQVWRTALARLYALREAVYATLYAFIRVTQGTCIAAYRDPRLYTKEDH